MAQDILVKSFKMVRKVKASLKYFSPTRLFSIATDSVLQHLSRSCDQLTLENIEDYQEGVGQLLDQLPSPIQDHILKEAELIFDCPQKVNLLLLIWMSVIKDPIQRTTITTPRYLCSSKPGRLLVLKHLLQVKSYFDH